ncbi:ArsR/SmtB family transcription factor [Pseudarthrobacter sp. YS3]|jgi:DNA-binding transcriptional ArsR family regulator|uniref:ArsR/SmtB family transcription factor n=1 Tax=Pseudarthrobacter sp. YS3 TaxID=3453718 RepID=UPI003EEE571A
MKPRTSPALSGQTRLRIAAILHDGPSCPKEIADSLGLSQAHVSNQLAALKGHKIARSYRQGRHMVYTLETSARAKVAAALRHAREEPASGAHPNPTRPDHVGNTCPACGCSSGEIRTSRIPGATA